MIILLRINVPLRWVSVEVAEDSEIISVSVYARTPNISKACAVQYSTVQYSTVSTVQNAINHHSIEVKVFVSTVR